MYNKDGDKHIVYHRDFFVHRLRLIKPMATRISALVKRMETLFDLSKEVYRVPLLNIVIFATLFNHPRMYVYIIYTNHPHNHCLVRWITQPKEGPSLDLYNPTKRSTKLNERQFGFHVALLDKLHGRWYPISPKQRRGDEHKLAYEIHTHDVDAWWLTCHQFVIIFLPIILRLQIVFVNPIESSSQRHSGLINLTPHINTEYWFVRPLNIIQCDWWSRIQFTELSSSIHLFLLCRCTNSELDSTGNGHTPSHKWSK